MEISDFHSLEYYIRKLGAVPKKRRSNKKRLLITDESLLQQRFSRLISSFTAVTVKSPDEPSSSSSRKIIIDNENKEEEDYSNSRNLEKAKVSEEEADQVVVKRKIIIDNENKEEEEDYSNSRNLKKAKVSEEEADQVVVKKASEKKKKARNNNNANLNGGERKVLIIDGPDPAPAIPEEMKNFIETELGAYDIELILQKELFDSDISRQQNRLSIPIKKLKTVEFLTQRERDEAAKRLHGETSGDGDGRKRPNPIIGRKVMVVDPNRQIHVVDFKRWDLTLTSSFTFTGKWSDVVQQNNLVRGDLIQLYFFRDQECEPCFAIVKL